MPRYQKGDFLFGQALPVTWVAGSARKDMPRAGEFMTGAPCAGMTPPVRFG